MNEVNDTAPDESQAWSDEMETWLDEHQEALDDAQGELYMNAESEAAKKQENTGLKNPIGIRFQPAGKVYHFAAPAEMELEREDWVVVETVYGEQAGQVSETDAKLPDGVSPKRLKPVLRRASGLDMARFQLMCERAERMVEVAGEEIEAHKLDMKVFSAEFALDGNSAIVLCTGNFNKRDLNNFRRRIASRMKCRVEVRTVGPRDHAKALGGYGVCGELRCCCRFLTDFKPVSIRMAKDQAISMAPSDITGMCGRLRCCLAYEHAVYKEEAKNLPKIKARVQTEKGLGRVIDLDILKGEVVVEIPPHGPRIERERFRFSAEEVEVVQRKS
ncbi:MAG: PSP1 domain-containing protein [Anaerolineae bacterium]